MATTGGRSPREHLGLFDTPSTRREDGFALAVVGVMFVAFLAVLPASKVQLVSVPAFVPSISAVVFVGELIIASLLYAQAAVFRSRALTVLATGYVFTALLLIPFALTFPGAFSPEGTLLHAKVNTTAWLMIFRRMAGPLFVIAYVLLKPADPGAPEAPARWPAVLASVSAAAALAAALTALATAGHDLLPPMFANHRDTIPATMLAYNASNIAVLVVAIGLLLWRGRSLLERWLLVSLAASLIQSVLNVGVPARFTVGWYGLFLLLLISNLCVLLTLIAESNRLYVRLASSTAARSRERDARLLSMEGVASAISHEVGQPLAAATLSASTALASLTREQPNTDKAIRSLRDSIEGLQRAFAVTKSIRNTFGTRSNLRTEFDLNELVRETASLLETELAAEHVVVRLALSEALPPIRANRIQIQRVLVNLIMNAIEAMSATSRGRRIAIRSAAPDAETLRIDISDSGAGITPETLSEIFEPFVTTKASGMGLGLALCRTIVEDHGGRLWASAAEDVGATFHLDLRRAPAA